METSIWEMGNAYNFRKIFIKIVINYQLQKCWFIVFKEEETDEEEEEEEVDEIIDKPILLLDISPNFTKFVNLHHQHLIYKYLQKFYN